MLLLRPSAKMSSATVKIWEIQIRNTLEGFVDIHYLRGPVITGSIVSPQ